VWCVWFRLGSFLAGYGACGVAVDGVLLVYCGVTCVEAVFVVGSGDNIGGRWSVCACSDVGLAGCEENVVIPGELTD